MHSTAQKSFEAAQASGTAVLAQVKRNQAHLLACLQHLARSQSPRDQNETVVGKQCGCQEHRLVETFDITGQLDRAWDGLIVQAARVRRLTWLKQPATGRWTERSETSFSFYVCQIALSAADFAETVRAH